MATLIIEMDGGLVNEVYSTLLEPLNIQVYDTDDRRALLVSALTSRSGLPPLRPECAQIAEARPVSDITQAIEAIRLALRDLEGNVSPGAICGALTVKLR